MSAGEWSPPFCAMAAGGVECPACGCYSVFVREKETYPDGGEVEAFCGECHARLEVWASLNVSFSDAEVVT